MQTVYARRICRMGTEGTGKQVGAYVREKRQERWD